MYCNYQQDNWANLLPLAEFAYNNTPSAITRVSPFFTNKGDHLNITVYPKCDLTSTWAREFTVDLDSLHEFLHEEMAATQQHYQVLMDSWHILALVLKVGNLVYIKAEYFKST